MGGRNLVLSSSSQPIMPPIFAISRVFLFGILMLPSALVAGFSESLQSEQSAAMGLSQLSPAQVAVIDALIQKEATLARQGNVRGFAHTFTQRRSEQELASSGLNALTEKQKAALDGLVAERIADQSTSLFLESTKPTAYVALSKDWRPLEVHGSVSLFVGADSRGGSFYGGSMETTVTDRSGHFTLGFGYSQVRGKGLCPMYSSLDDYWLYSLGHPAYVR